MQQARRAAIIHRADHRWAAIAMRLNCHRVAAGGAQVDRARRIGCANPKVSIALGVAALIIGPALLNYPLELRQKKLANIDPEDVF